MCLGSALPEQRMFRLNVMEKCTASTGLQI